MRFEGELKSWEDDRGFGFLQPSQGGDEIFVHVKAIVNREGRPKVGQRFTFEIELGPRGKKRAKNVLPHRAEPPIRLNRRVEKLVGSEAPAPWAIKSIIAIPLFLLIYATVAVLWRPSLEIALAYALVSVATFVAYAIDKSAAIRGNWRVSEKTLHILALVGGWPGALLAQQLLRHKSSKAEFQWFFWATVIANVALFILVSAPNGPFATHK